MASSLRKVVAASVLLHAGFLAYGTWQDTHPVIKFTDVDYLVFTDGARFVSNGASPYGRATYRYTPLLAYLVLPNIYWFNSFGKLLFSSCDVLVGLILYDLLKLRGLEDRKAASWAAVWLINPFVIAISTRGNAESIVAALVLGTLWCISKDHGRLGAILYGVSVHFKIYPVIHALPIWLWLHGHRGVAHGSADSKGSTALMQLRAMVSPFFTYQRVEFAALSAGVFFILSGWMYYMWVISFLPQYCTTS